MDEEELNKKAKEYSFLIPSELYHKLPTQELRDLWVKECELHFKNGFKEGLKYESK